ncbi:MAG: biopolymer transporter ExbD [Candidatus Hydrogenedentes bacterium]|nr:biopolymer transporter ExbD [Candidatus Hydrogenedentota bacterium]
MNFRAPGAEKHRVKAVLDLTPIIDVVFNLIIFFMLSSTFVVQSSIQIQTPEAEGTRQLEAKDLSVTLLFGEGGPDGLGRIYVDTEEMMTWDALSERLAREMSEQPNSLILVRPDARIETGRLVRVLGIASQVGVKHYAIAAQPPETAE